MTSNRLMLSSFLAIFLTVPIQEAAAKPTSADKKKTVAELLSQMKEESRGGKVQLKKGETALPDAKVEFQQSTQRNLEDIKPPRSEEIFQHEGGLKAEYEKVLEQQINELYKLTRQFKNSPNRGELWLRLAELYVEKSAYIDAKKQDDYDRRLHAFQTGKTTVKPKLDTAEAREYNKKSLQLYQWFERDFPRDPKMPQALFFLGYNYFELGDEDKGVHYYQQLVKKFPESPFVTEAYFALGEYYFDNDKWKEAYQNYSPLIKDKHHPLHTFAMYKGAWALYRLGKFQQALSYIEYIIKSGKTASEGELASKKAVNTSRLESEALRDLVIFYAAVGGAENAEKYFANMAGGDVTPHLEKLAMFYGERGNKDAASLILKDLILKSPTGAKSFSYQYQIVQNYFYAKNSPRFKEELYRWVKDYDAKSPWYTANAANKELVSNSYKLRETTLKNYALQQHQTAQNSRTAYSQAQANEAYQIYMATFPDSPSVGDMHFYYGELLYDMGKFDEAASEYNWVVENTRQNKYFDKAATNLIHAVEKGVPSDKELSQRIGTSIEPVPLDPKIEKFIKSAKWYIQNFPNSDKNPEIQFRIGRLYYQNNHFNEAHEVFKKIVQKYPKNKYSEYSANLILDIFSLKKDYAGLEKMGTELLANPAISDSKAGADIRGVLEKASFKKAQDLETSKNFGESAVQYEAFAKQNPKSELAVQAQFNAGVNYEKAAQNASALACYQRVARSKDENHKDLKLKSKRLSAKLLQDSGQFEESAKLFKEVAHEDMKDPLSPNLIFTAAALYEVVGRNEEALRTYDEFLKVGKKRQDQMDATYAMAQIHRKLGQKKAAIEKFEKYTESNPSDANKLMEAEFRLMEVYQSQRKVDDAEKWRKKILSLYKRLPANKKKSVANFAAKVRMKDAEEAYAKFKAVRLSSDPAKLKKSIDEKLQGLKELNRVIKDVIEYDSADEIISGLTLLGQSYQHMGDSLVKAPMPKGLNAEEQKMYKDKVAKELADPQYKQARESYQKAVEKAWELEAYPAAYNSAFEYMNHVDPKTYYDGGETAMDSRLVNWMAK
jgi:tetratricopeptide (TPR) repeat protein